MNKTLMLAVAGIVIGSSQMVPDVHAKTLTTVAGATEVKLIPLIVPDPKSILNPDFQPQCKWIMGVYVCTDFAKDYCQQYPRREDCRFAAIPFSPQSGHAINLLRRHLGGGVFQYCFVEPNGNAVVSCWIGDEDDWDNAPEYVYRQLCLYYRSLGSTCEKLTKPLAIYPFEKIPDEGCHFSTGGCREGFDIPTACWDELKGDDWTFDFGDCSRLSNTLPASCAPPQSSLDEFLDARYLFRLVCGEVFTH